MPDFAIICQRQSVQFLGKALEFSDFSPRTSQEIHPKPLYCFDFLVDYML
jgi:hypothetical protein